MDKIVVIVMEPGKPARQESIDNSLASLQQLVGGYIETVNLSGGRILIVNEEGMLKDLPGNRVFVYPIAGHLVTLLGTIVMVRAKGEEFVSIHGGDLEWVENHSQIIQ